MDDDSAGDESASETAEEAGGDGAVPPTGEDGEDIDPEEIPEGATENHWKQLVLEMEESADQHRAAGWGTTTLHPTASGVVADPESGIGVVVEREEFDALDEVVSRREINEYEVLRADLPGEIQLLVILYTADGDRAIFLPAAVDADRLDGLRSQVGEEFYTHVTPEDDDATISFTHDDPELFFPGTEIPRTAETRSGLQDEEPGDDTGGEADSEE